MMPSSLARPLAAPHTPSPAPVPRLRVVAPTVPTPAEELARHDRLLRLALRRGKLGTLARLYRRRIEQNPADGFAQRRLTAIQRLACLPLRTCWESRHQVDPVVRILRFMVALLIPVAVSLGVLWSVLSWLHLHPLA